MNLAGQGQNQNLNGANNYGGNTNGMNNMNMNGMNNYNMGNNMNGINNMNYGQIPVQQQSNMGLIALISSIISLVTCSCCCIGAGISALLSVLAISNPRANKKQGVIALILSIVSALMLLVVSIFGSMTGKLDDAKEEIGGAILSETLENNTENTENNTDSTDNDSTSTSGLTPLGKTIVTTASLNEEVEVSTEAGEYTFKITGIHETDERNNYSDIKADRVVIIDYEYTNVDYTKDSTLKISDTDFRLYDKDDNELDYYPISYTYPEKAYKGETKTAQMAFALNNDTNYIAVDYYDDFFSDEAYRVEVEW